MFEPGGVGAASGLLLYIVVKDVVPYIQRRRNGTNGQVAGSQPVSFWQKEMRDANKEALRDAAVPILMEIRDAIRESNKAMQDTNKGLVILLERSAKRR